MDEGRLAYGRYLAGDSDALGVLVALYNAPLIRYLTGIVRDPYAAEDIAADTFLALLLKKPNFRSESSFKTFLFKIARHKAVDSLRRKTSRAALPLEEELTGEEDPLWAGILRDERSRALYRAMERLHPDYRGVLELLYFEELTAEETGAVLGKSKKQTSNLLYRAKEALRKELAKEGITDANAFD